jgi:anti-sigma factor RsiW
MSDPMHAEDAGTVPHDCETIVRRLWDYLDGRLPHVQHTEVEAHLAACAHCPPHFAFAERLRASIGAAVPEVSDDDASRLRARVRRALEGAVQRSVDADTAPEHDE